METENSIKDTSNSTSAIENEHVSEKNEQVAAATDSKECNERALKQCEQEVAEWKDKFLRTTADFQNYKKRLEKEQTNLSRMVKADMLCEILNVVDNFDRALEVNLQEAETSQTWLEGFELIRKELYKFLEKNGVSQLESYEVFDPELHEAVMQVEAEKEPGAIVEVLQKGYMLHDTVLRPAKVSVAK